MTTDTDVDTTRPGTFAAGWNDRLDWKDVPRDRTSDYLDGYEAARRAFGYNPAPANQRFNERVGK